MNPFWYFGRNQRPPMLQVNLRAFRIVAIFAVYAIIALSVFGHL